MSQVSTVLDRTDRFTHEASVIAQGSSAFQVAMPVADRLLHDDDDVLDEWLASVSVDDFERFLSGLAALR